MMFQTNKSILLTGSKGRMGTEIQKLVPVTAIDRAELDVTNPAAVAAFLSNNHFDIIIHCAAYTDVAGAENNKDACYTVNVHGTENLIKKFAGERFIYISTDYVFDGQRGNYCEDDTPNPVNYYALTKLLGEAIVRQYPKSLVIRTSFKADGPWPYPKAFNDQWTTADYVSERAPQIVAAALMPELFGVIHIGGERKSIYELAKKQTPGVQQMSIHDIPTILPPDVTLDSSRWKKLIHPLNA